MSFNTVIASLIPAALYDSGIAKKVAGGLGSNPGDSLSYDTIILTRAILQPNGVWKPVDAAQPVTHRMAIGPVRSEFSDQAQILYAAPEMLFTVLSQRLGVNAPTLVECQQFCTESQLFINKDLPEILVQTNLMCINNFLL